MKKVQGFISPENVSEAEAAHNATRANLTPAQLAIVEQADAAMREVEQVFDGPIRDEDVNLILSVFRANNIQDTPSNREDFRRAVVSKNPGDYFSIGNQIFFMTGDRKVQEARAYVNRLEKSLIKVMQMNQDLQARLVPKTSLFDRIKKLFSGGKK